LGFSAEDRTENIRRIGEVAKLFVDSGQIVLTAFISPFRQDRQLVRNKLAQDEFVEVYVRCPLETCEQRDPKGLYKKARNGEIRDFTGIDSPYEPPLSPDVVVDTDQHSIEQCVQQIISYLKNKQWI
ncbi:adenylyl-sulfate kinase, partial [Pseudoalteromonas sp. 0303]|nr:adenylyl-sulfate kinase [Pseudoalteromonas sp. 0303]